MRKAIWGDAERAGGGVMVDLSDRTLDEMMAWHKRVIDSDTLYGYSKTEGNFADCLRLLRELKRRRAAEKALAASHYGESD